jgi:hypothetical protein
MLGRFLSAAILGAVTVTAVNASEVTAEWVNNGASSPEFAFHLDLQATGLSDTFTIHGYAVYPGSTNRESVVGSATYSPHENVYVVSMFFNSNTGESFSIGANLSPVSLVGPGNLIRVGHGGVDDDSPGVFSVTH